MKIKANMCDAPLCRNHDLSEDGIGSPYGWVRADVEIVGSGPRVKVEVCSDDCLLRAINEARREF